MTKKVKRARKSAALPAPRLTIPAESTLSPKQKSLLKDIRKTRGSGPLGGPFAVFLQAPEYGDLAQKLGAFCRYKTSVPPRLSEFTILVLARFWRSQYEFWVHAPIAQKAGVKAATIEALRTGRTPRLGKEERAIYDFIAELHKTKRVADKTYARVHALFGDAGMVEFVGILGYYTLVAMTLNVFRVPLPEGQTYPFAEPRGA
ncbi:carboxymuconolactone decarboxylase family protein [Pseudorhodoplanes sp.]|jgi:4-carboxymuconolactone decarboxylase|uniref:carboxymuconolactone decarboxylase family protein n=1 Tax=Pseudorhodoplanes sp. TaxID=1934341 RepID=UPI002B64CCDE|nr:carboxymuconolactone decarboxylase family protein [Pseudorhodoplanes sp.]HWV41272.1 carboxymuconolactone decarboxylase family protein [Pseudorhodoplanes sp.]